MPRPVKGRNVCCLPLRSRYGPVDGAVEPGRSVVMSVDEYETVRLIDLEGMTQEECAVQMNVARTTVQRIYEDARRKLADFIVNGSLLNIEGGKYSLCDDTGGRPGCCGCARRGLRHGRGPHA
jgi:uncharacterized protein